MNRAERELELYREAIGNEAARRQSELARRTCQRCMRVIGHEGDHSQVCPTPKWLPRG